MHWVLYSKPNMLGCAKSCMETTAQTLCIKVYDVENHLQTQAAEVAKDGVAHPVGFAREGA